MKLSRYYFLVFLFSISNLLHAQTLNFKHISYKEGLVQSPISCFLQDKKGFIWFGNFKGLMRYDGYEFKSFISDLNVSSTISNNRVNAIFQDSDQQLWIATANGLNSYNSKLETFNRIDIREIKGGRNYISSIVEDQQKNIWVGTFGGLKKLNKKTWLLEDIPGTYQNMQFKNSPVFSLFLDAENNIWAGTKEGLVKFNPRNQKILPLPSAFLQNENFTSNKVLVIKQDMNNDLWFGTEISGAFRYSKNQNTLQNYSFREGGNSIASNWVKDILVRDRENVWFATRNGISTLNTGTQLFTNYKHDPLDPKSLNDNAVWSFLKDKNNCIWVGTFAGGINFYYHGNSNFQNVGENVGKPLALNHILVTAVTEDRDSSFWVGTFGGGLNHINRKANTSKYYNIRAKNTNRPSNGVKSLADDGKGNLWVGTLDGLSLFNKASENLTYFDFKARDGRLSENLILCILPDGEGAWIGTNGGGLRYTLKNGSSPILLIKKTPKSGSNYAYDLLVDKKTNHVVFNDLPSSVKKEEMDISDNFVTALLKDGPDHLWIGTQNGLNYYDIKANKITRLYQKVRDTKYQLSNSNVSALFRDSKNRLWVGTEEGGLNYFDQQHERFYSIDKKEGLQDNVIHSIVEDDKNNIWVSTDLGLYKIGFKKFSPPFKAQDLNIISYTANDGLISNQFSTQAGLRLKSEEILFGGINGLTIFYPDRIIKNVTPPGVVITELLVNNSKLEIGSKNSPLSSSITETQEIELPHNQSNLSIKYAALNFINPENNTYAYKLEGLSLADKWQIIGKQRVVNFANLPPGEYIFRVKAANNDGVWSNEVRSLKISILPPFWLTWWAYLIYIVVSSVIVYVIVSFMRNRERLKRDLYLEHVHNEKLNELYSMKLNFFTNISHEIRTPLTLILGPVEKLISENENVNFLKSLRLVKSNADRLMRLVTELLDFRKAEEGHMKIYCTKQDIIAFCFDIYKSFESLAIDKNITYDFLSPSVPALIYFDKNQLEKVIFNLLSNAFKFTDNDGQISLSINYSANSAQWLEVVVTDNGKGIPEDFQDKLFESFFQVDDRGRQNIGSGIGLALAKNIVELHKGVIKVESHASLKNQTSFTVSLQTGKSHLSSAEIAQREVAFERAAQSVMEPTMTEEEVTGTERTEKKKYKLMIVEDNVEVRGLLEDTLKAKYNIVTCPDGQVALDILEKELPDLIVSDIMMPGVDGLQFCEMVKSSEATNHIPFILLTARASVSHQLEGLGTGADAYLSKPFSLQLLELNIRNLLRAQEILREKFSKRIVIGPGNIDVVTPEEKFISKLMQIIERRMEDPSFDVLDLVSEIGMSRTVLYKKVQMLTSYSVADLIKEMRLKRAAELLKNTSFNITEITYMVGFNDRKHFSKEFKKQYDLTPSEYIKGHKSAVN